MSTISQRCAGAVAAAGVATAVVLGAAGFFTTQPAATGSALVTVERACSQACTTTAIAAAFPPAAPAIPAKQAASAHDAAPQAAEPDYACGTCQRP